MSRRGSRLASRRADLAQWLLVGVLVVVGLIFILPFLWIFSTSLRLPKDSFNLPPSFLPTAFVFKNYLDVFTAMPFVRFFLNSLQVAAVATFGQSLIAALAAYAFARIRFPGRDAIFFLMLSGLMISNQVVAIPQFIMVAKLRLMDNHWVLAVLWMVNPLGIFLMRQFMKSIPDSYEEAAWMDGASRLWVFARIIVPMSFPAIAVSAVTWFVAVWNDFFRPLILLSTWENMTLPLGMTVLRTAYGAGNLSALLAGVTLSLIPAVVLFSFGQRYLIEGLTVGGVKQ
jgi:multiple sugar transport system permease protein